MGLARSSTSVPSADHDPDEEGRRSTFGLDGHTTDQKTQSDKPVGPEPESGTNSRDNRGF